MISLTRTQANALAFIAHGIAENGLAPSYEEIGVALGLASKSAVHRLVKCLEERGAIRRMPGRARAIELCPTRDALRSFSDAALLAEVERRGLR
jgi:repressor LexA